MSCDADHALGADQELWGRCGPCARWFYIQTRCTAVVAYACPVCGQPALQLQGAAPSGAR